mmetsp:Transcript_64815/g.200704  ORF Transcript_64815/g.200704 Transcript_64815/m.200704 type:complete len:595 (+) Transcript_64815:67-1851(+)
MASPEGPWSPNYPPGAYQGYRAYGGFPGGSGGQPMYQPLPGTGMTAFDDRSFSGSPSGMPFSGSQIAAPFSPPQPPMSSAFPPLNTSPLVGLPAFGRYYDRGFQARSQPFSSSKLQLEEGELESRPSNGKPGRNMQASDGISAQAVFVTLCSLVGILVAVVAGYTAWLSYCTRWSDRFLTFSVLATGRQQSYFTGIMSVFIVLACLAMLAALTGCLACIPSRPNRSALEVSGLNVAGFACLLYGCVFLILTLVTLFVGNQAKPSAVRTANIVCQDLRAWSCRGDGTVVSHIARLLEEVSPPSQSWGDRLQDGFSPGLPSPGGRRLDAASSAVGYMNSLNTTVNTSSGVSERCLRLEELCNPPIGFDAATACVCSGFWRKPSENHSGAVVGPWNGTEGAYCAKWNPEQAPWCFVSPHHSCATPTHSTHVAGQRYEMSIGPCMSEVDSRSQFVLDGYHELMWSLWAPALLGVVLILLSFFILAIPCLTPAEPKLQQDEHVESPDSTPVADDKDTPLTERFEKAQKKAMRSLRDSTPEEVKLLLYGFYDQAMYGDVQGPRPAFFNNKDRRKYDSWAKLRGMPKTEAMEGYIKATDLI